MEETPQSETRPAPTFGAVLKSCRENAELSQVNAAKAAKVSPRAWIYWEKNERFPLGENLAKILALFPGDRARLTDAVGR